MKGISRATLGFLAAISGIASASDVHDLKADTFDAFIKDNDIVLAEFFAPWCGHCKALAPEYEEAATSLKDKGIALAKVDCTAEADLCKTHGVEGYPTLKVFRGLDNVSPYGGQRKAPSIVSYMVKQSLPAVSTVTKDSLEEFKSSDKVVVVGFFEAGDKKSNETYTALADSMRDNYLFGATNDADLAKAEGVSQPGVVLYKTFDEGKAVHDGKFDKDALSSFVKVSATPLIGEVGPETYSDYMEAGIPLGYIFAETPEERAKLVEELTPVAKKHKGKVNIATIDAKQYGQHGENLNLKVGTWPAFAIQETVKNQKFPMSQDKKLTEKEVMSFVDDFVAGKLTPSIKSEPIPEKQEGPVTVVVAHNYDEVVLKNDKDVLVEFYAPWCGHCKSLAPKYDELARQYAAEKQVVIAKVDATANDVPEDISGFPTIKLFPAKAKDAPVDYSGSRTVEDLAAFIRDNGSHKVYAYVAAEDSTVKSSDMPEQAPAASKGAGEKVKEAAEKVAEAVVGDEDDSMDDHDEL